MLDGPSEEKIPLKSEPIQRDSDLISVKELQALPRPDLTIRDKFMFAFASFPAGLLVNIKGFFLNTFILEVAQLNPYYSGVLFLATKAIDAVSDPLVGRFSDRTNSRWGRRRPWLLFGALPLALSWAALWMVPDLPNIPKFIYFLIFVILTDLCYTVVHIPYTAMASEICTNYDERTTLTTFTSMATILGGTLPPFIHSEIVRAFPGPDGEPNYVLGYAVSAGVMGFLICSMTLVTFFGTASIKSVQQKPEENPGGFFRSMIVALKFKPFLIVMMMFLLSNLAIQFMQNNLFLYAQICLEAEDHFSYMLLVIEGSTLINLFIWSRIAARFGKKLVYVVGNIVFCLVVASLYFIPARTLWLAYLISGIAGVGVSVGLLIPWSMLPDCIDAFELDHGKRYEGMFYSVFVLFQKGALALGMGMSNFVLAANGYISPPPSHPLLQPAQVRDALRVLLGPIPLAILLLSFVFAYSYPISRDIHSAVAAKLKKDREERESSGKEDGAAAADTPKEITNVA